MDEKKIQIGYNYQTDFQKNQNKFIVFYNQEAMVNGRSWTLNSFIANPKFQIHDMMFFQGVSKEHDSFHVWYDEIDESKMQ